LHRAYFKGPDMNLILRATIITSLALGFGVGCKSKPEQIEPARAGERNSSCLAKNDCEAGLSCIFGRCSPTDFDFKASGKECNIVQCETTDDCCGDNPQTVPEKCEGRATVCSPTLAGCNPAACDGDTDCDGGGTCGSTYCSQTFEACDSNTDCEDVCTVDGYCSLSLGACLEDTDCVQENTCGGGQCDCSNPDYDFTDPICTDESCDTLCVLKCEDRICVSNFECETAEDCFGAAGNMCVDGACVECEMDEDCDEESEEACVSGICEKPCKFDEECDQFESCKKGECVFQGCQSDLECALDPATTAVEPRLLRCIEGADGFGACKLPCDVDAHCAATEICASGYCKDIGCADDLDCATIVGTSNQDTSTERPYVSRGVCEAVGE
jgi:hypothetical protein